MYIAEVRGTDGRGVENGVALMISISLETHFAGLYKPAPTVI